MRPDVVSRHFDAMDTTCTLFATDKEIDADLAAAEQWVKRTADRLTRFLGDSELSELNRRAGEWCAVSGELESVLRAALGAYAMSSGLVNAAVLPSMVAIGYTRSLADGHGIATLERARPLPPLPEVLQVRPGQARVARGAGIDLGGIAKGWMADRLSEQIGSECVVNLGGDLRVRGQWPIGIGPATLMLRDQGAATSSVRKRRWADVHHLIDPRTGLPARTGLQDVSVVCPTALEAEVVAKTALLLGLERAPEYCAQHAMAWWLA